MSITTKEINALRELQKRTSRGCGNGLLIIRDPRAKRGGLYFCGRMRRKINGKLVVKDCWIGTYGNGPDDFTLKSAMKKWIEIRSWAKENNRDPSDYVKRQHEESQNQKNLKDAVDRFLDNKMNKIKETTYRDYCLKLNNQVFRHIDPGMPLRDLEWGNGGRQIVMKAVENIGDGGKFDLANRCQKLLCGVFNSAISAGWMYQHCEGGGRNPAGKFEGDESPASSTRHHPSIHWEQVPKLLVDVQLNRSSTNIQSVAATKLLLMTFLRAGALARLQWKWFNTTHENTITIPGSTSGLKRKKGKNDYIPHHVPITPQMQQIFDLMQQLNGHTQYVFAPLRASRFPHLDPSAPNNYLKNLGYKDVLRAHGWRSTALTTGIDVLGADRDVIKKQMGHLPEGKVDQAYDKSLRLDDRRKFLEDWCNLLEVNGLKV